MCQYQNLGSLAGPKIKSGMTPNRDTTSVRYNRGGSILLDLWDVSVGERPYIIRTVNLNPRGPRSGLRPETHSLSR